MVMTLPLMTTTEGVLLPVHAQPRARKNFISSIHNGRLKVCVTAAPEKGAANEALEKTIAKELGLKRSQVALATGPTSNQKTFLITGVTADWLNEMIDDLLAQRDS